MSLKPFPTGFDKEGSISFSTEDTNFKLPEKRKIVRWLKRLIEQEGTSLHLLNFIFCSDEYLLRLNVEYLDHDTLTDIITFPYAEPPDIEGDIFISIDRVKENALDFKTSFLHELHRVMAHGVLHLCGYGDKSEAEEKLMREKENGALALWEV